MKIRSITARWIINNLGIIIIILVMVMLSASFFIKDYYYNSARQYINSRMNMVTGVLTRYSRDSGTNFSAEVRSTVENFNEKDKIELMAISNDGGIAITSSGFSPKGTAADMPDYIRAIETSGSGYSVGRLESGEKVMAVSSVIGGIVSEFSAVRMVVSLDQMDRHISQIILAVGLLCAAILCVTVFSGLYFVKSIVIPVRQIGTTAARFAKGDFSARIEKKNDDEIGGLSDIFNTMAEELSKTEHMKNEFISSVSHELRTPLTAIKGWSETLSDMTDDPETIKKGMHVITNESERLAQMVEELLDFSRMQNGRFALEKTTFDVLAELGEAVLIYQEKAKKEELQLLYNDPELLPFIYGDKNRIKQVFINIIDNAIKYSDKGGIVTVEATATEDIIKIAVSDTGCGISESDLPRIKTKFFKANHTRRGSGIGLAVADEIITMHNGRLDIFSEQGVGTTVVITIPTATA